MPRSNSFNIATSPKRALLDIPPDTTDAELVAAVPGYIIVVLQVLIICGPDATDITFCSMDGASVPISPLISNAANGGAVLPFTEAGWFETVRGEMLCATTSAGSDVGVLIAYALI